MMPDLPFYPVGNLFPLPVGADFEALKADIQAHGQAAPVWTFEGAIIDGRIGRGAPPRPDPGPRPPHGSPAADQGV